MTPRPSNNHPLRRSPALFLLVPSLALAAFAGARSQPEPDAPEPARAAPPASSSSGVTSADDAATTDQDVPAWGPWRERLEALSPADPRAYFTLGEEVAATADTPDSVTLASTLYVLAMELDRRRQRAGAAPDPGLAASACLALADLSRQEDTRRWLVALARSLDRRYASPDWSRAAQPTYSGQAGFKAAEFLGLVRSGDGNRAQDLLADPEVARILEDNERLLGGPGSSGMLRAMVLAAKQWPCPQCGNSRIARLAETNPPRKGLCPTCNANPGPYLTTDDMIQQLRFESVLLDGIQDSWSAQMALDLGAPLREPRAEELAPTMGVDPELAYFRGGRWVRSPSGESVPPSPDLPTPPRPRQPAEPTQRPALPTFDG